MLDLKLAVMVFMEPLWPLLNLMKILRKKTNCTSWGSFYRKTFNGACLELMKDNSIISIQDIGLQD